METKADWLRSEIEKLEKKIIKNSVLSDKTYRPNTPNDLAKISKVIGHNQALTSIITRYKEELKVLESK